MNRLLLRSLLLTAALGLAVPAPAANVLPSNDAKKLAERYALTKSRISDLLGARLHPEALPTTALPNPFYRPSTVEPVAPPTDPIPVISAPDERDIDTLTRYATTLKINGYLIVNGLPHVTINGAVNKVGDVINVGPKDRPVFIHVDAITPQEVTFRLNEAVYVLPLKM